MVLYEISDIGYSNVRFVTRNDRYTWSEDEILKYWIRDGKISQWSKRFNWQVKESIFRPLPSPLRSEIINSCTNCKLSHHTDTEIRSYIRINKSIVIDFVSPEIVFYFVNSFLDWHLLANSLFPEIRLIEYLHGSVNYKPFVRNVSMRTRLTDEFPFACKKRKEEEKRRKNFDVRFLKKEVWEKIKIRRGVRASGNERV